MLQYTKFILHKMSFDQILFEKELRKAIGLMTSEECLELKAWCITQFGDKFQDTISLVFAKDEQQLNTQLVN
ncbi:hypothetical protein [uncultured Microscilla sp.]|uniref:hypothetical protein n=1 Tax=uncultured Microscilla sp. TaxID=432653 RepID=UPI0026078C93|nr:hypothetical protein [uncultured Microscilla sp.]